MAKLMVSHILTGEEKDYLKGFLILLKLRAGTGISVSFYYYPMVSPIPELSLLSRSVGVMIFPNTMR